MNEDKVSTATLLPGGGIGSISRQDRFDQHLDNLELANEAEIELISGNYNIDTTTYYITRCGDGRKPENNNGGLQAFGATPGIIKSKVIANFLAQYDSAAEAIKHEVAKRNSDSKQSGAHRADTHGKDNLSGCGECDGSQIAIENYLQYETTLKPLVMSLWTELDIEDKYGVFPEKIYEEIILTLRSLYTIDYFIDGSSQVSAVENIGEPDRIESLVGDHKEVAWVINLVENTKFNQDVFLKKYDSFEDDKKGIQIFWEDQWAIEKELEDSPKAIVADLVRRVATAVNLTKADLKLIVLR